MAPVPPDPVYIFRKNMIQINYLFINLENNNELLYVGTNEGLVHIWDLKTKREINVIKIGEGGCLKIERFKDRFITQEKGGLLKYWKVEGDKWNLMDTIKIDYYGFCKILASNDRIYFPSHNGLVTILQGDHEMKLQHGSSNRIGEVMCMKYLEEVESLLVAYEDGSLILWLTSDIEVPKVLCEIKINDTPMCFDICNSTMEGVVGGSGDILNKISIVNDKISITRSTNLTNPGVSSVVLSNEGKLCVAGCWDGRIRYFSMKHLTLLAVLEHGVCPVKYVMFSNQSLSSCSEGALLAAGDDGRISLWDLYTNRKKVTS